MYLAAHAYFTLYHTVTNLVQRRWYSSDLYARLRGSSPLPYSHTIATALLVVTMAWTTSAMEAITIAGFPYYHIEDRGHMLTVGSVVYGLYFIVSFPMYYRMDEDDLDGAAAGRWSLFKTGVESLGGCMAVTLLLDFYRIAYLHAKQGHDGAGHAGLAWAVPPPA